MTRQREKRRHEIEEMLAELDRTGETIAAYARRRGVATWGLYKARRRQRSAAPAKLVSVEVGEPLARQASLELVVGDVVVRVPSGFDEDELSRLVRTLRAC